MIEALTQLAGAALIVAGCFVIATWLGLIVAGVGLVLAAEVMERIQ